MVWKVLWWFGELVVDWLVYVVMNVFVRVSVVVDMF